MLPEIFCARRAVTGQASRLRQLSGASASSREFSPVFSR